MISTVVGGIAMPDVLFAGELRHEDLGLVIPGHPQVVGYPGRQMKTPADWSDEPVAGAGTIEAPDLILARYSPLGLA